MPTRAELLERDVLVLTPEGHGTHTPMSTLAMRKTWEGQMVKKKDRVRILLTEINDEPAMISAAHISGAESRCIDKLYLAAGNLITRQTVQNGIMAQRK